MVARRSPSKNGFVTVLVVIVQVKALVTPSPSRNALRLAASVRRHAMISGVDGFPRRGAVAGAVTALATRPAEAADCFAVATAARQTIANTIAGVEKTGDPNSLRPTAKTLLNGPLRACLADASRLNDAFAPHARDALEYLASVVEFDAFDKLTKSYEPKLAQAYTPAKIDYSLRALRAADRELGTWLAKYPR